MQKRVACLLFMVLCLVITGCVPGSVFVVPSDTPMPTSLPPTSTLLPTFTDTPTPLPSSTFTPTPTIEPPTPTPTIERPVEWDLEPYIEKDIDVVWQGVRIKASVIIDSSLAYFIKNLEIKEERLAELVARYLFLVWYGRQNPWAGWCSNNRITWGVWHFWVSSLRAPVLKRIPIEPFMEDWAEAQLTGAASDWRNVQLNNIWANDLSDGNGYIQKPYNLWPMFQGDPPYGVKAIDSVTIVFIDLETSTNLPKSTVGYSYGTNLDGNNLFLYLGIGNANEMCVSSEYQLETCLERSLPWDFLGFGPWLFINDGRKIEETFFGQMDTRVCFGDYQVQLVIQQGGIEFDVEIE